MEIFLNHDVVPHFGSTQLEKQVHEDEEFARTLAMLDEEPQAKKVILKKQTNTRLL